VRQCDAFPQAYTAPQLRRYLVNRNVAVQVVKVGLLAGPLAAHCAEEAQMKECDLTAAAAFPACTVCRGPSSAIHGIHGQEFHQKIKMTKKNYQQGEATENHFTFASVGWATVTMTQKKCQHGGRLAGGGWRRVGEGDRLPASVLCAEATTRPTTRLF